MNTLRKQGVISYQQGKITVQDRKGLERTAGEAYGTPEAEYRRLIGGLIRAWILVVVNQNCFRLRAGAALDLPPDGQRMMIAR